MITVVADLPSEDWRRLNRLLALALELDADQRAQWLGDLPVVEADLVPLVERLLRESVPEVPGHTSLPRPSMQLMAEQWRYRQSQPGDSIGPYRLNRQVGQGGMATVWLADRVDGRIDRQVALKIPHAEWSDRGLADRARRECAVLASLNHPNVAQLYDAGWSESGIPYLAMEIVDGEPIDQYCRQRNLDVRMRLRLFIEVLRAVAYAHARLVVHRDLKPANVFVTNEGRVKLLDFGVAKILASDPASGGESELTRTSGQPVTLSYASPEQLLGQPVTTATDIYALGVMLFELLCDQRPFPPTDAGRSALETALARGDPPPPSSLAPDTAVRRQLRGDLDIIVGKALNKDPDQRFETAAAFVDDLERYLDGRAVLARRASAWYQLRRFAVRNRVPLVAVAAVVAAVLIGLTVALRQARLAQAEALNAAAIGNFVLAVIQQADPGASQQTRASDLALLSTVEGRVDRELKGRPDLEFPLRMAVATAYRNRGEDKEAVEVLHLALSEAAVAPGIARLDLLRARVLLGAATTDDKERATQLEAAIPALRELGHAAAPVLVDALLAQIPDDILKNPGADKGLREALAIATSQLGLTDERTLKAADRLASSLGPGVLGHNAEAAGVLGPPLLAVRRSNVLPMSNPVLLHAQSTYGHILCALGRADEGIPLLEETVRSAIDQHHDGQQLRAALLYLARGQRYAGQGEASTATLMSIYTLLASREPFGSRLRYYYGLDVSYSLLQGLRRPLEAEPFIAEAQAFRDSLSPAEQSLAAEADFQIGFRRLGTLLRLGQYDEARRIGEALLQKYRDEKAPYYQYVVNIYMGDIELATGHPAEAEAAAQAALDFALQQGGAADDQALHYGALSRIKLARGDATAALAITAHERNRPTPSAADDPDLADFNVARGRALLALGRAAEAREPLATAQIFWSAAAPESHSARIATYWYAAALTANHQADAARNLHPPARMPIDYPPPDLLRLRADRSAPDAERIAAVSHRYPLRPEIAALIAHDAAPAIDQ